MSRRRLLAVLVTQHNTALQMFGSVLFENPNDVIFWSDVVKLFKDAGILGFESLFFFDIFGLRSRVATQRKWHIGFHLFLFTHLSNLHLLLFFLISYFLEISDKL